MIILTEGTKKYVVNLMIQTGNRRKEVLGVQDKSWGTKQGGTENQQGGVS